MRTDDVDRIVSGTLRSTLNNKLVYVRSEDSSDGEGLAALRVEVVLRDDAEELTGDERVRALLKVHDDLEPNGGIGLPIFVG